MNKLVHQSTRFIKRNASTILTCVGGVGVVATSVMAVKATPKALQLLEAAEKEKGEKLTGLEMFKVAGPIYIPTVIVGVGTLACVFGANMLNKRQQASLMSAYALLDGTYKDYKKKTTELYGTTTDQIIKTEIAKDKYDENKVIKSDEDEKELFYDSFSDRYFESTMATVLKAEYEINKKITDFAGANVNEFYDWLGLEPIYNGENYGWVDDILMANTWSKWLTFEHTKVTLDDGLECTIIDYEFPTYDFLYY